MTGELIIDSFAGGGGASEGIEIALGRGPDVAINHDAEALALHAANHPDTLHLPHNVWKVDPLEVTKGRPVGLLWASPDCKHFSKALGGKPKSRNIRDLAWVVVRWAKQVRPRVIILENVEEFRTWGPVSEDGRPCPKRSGQTFNLWAAELRRLGYRLEHRELRACGYGTPTIRKRLFLIARRDGLPIVWPEPTHGDPASAAVKAGRLKPWRTAAEILDWSLPCHSIFLTREEGRAVGVNRPLAPNTLARIAKGLKRYVLENPDPFIVPGRGQGRAGDRSALVAAFLAQHNYLEPGHDAREPLSTIVSKGCTQNVVEVSLLSHHYTSNTAGGAGDPRHPLKTVTAGGWHTAEVRAFLVKYFGTDQDPRLGEPLHTVTTKDRFGLVTVQVGGHPYVIADIGMRMLSPRELFRAQGFGEDYIIDRGRFDDGTWRPLTKTAQVRMCGNSVCPPLAAALVAANYRPDEAGLGRPRVQPALPLLALTEDAA